MKVLYEEEARDSINSGVEKLYRAVKTTLGPAGRNVIIHSKGQEPIITHDGVTVAESVAFSGTGTDMAGVELVKSSARKMGEVGDGTTTVTVLTYHIMQSALKLVKDGYSPMKLWKQLITAGEEAQKLIDKRVKQVDTTKLYEVASISAGDAELGKLVADVVNQVGAEGFVVIEETQATETTSEIVKGFTTHYGFASPYFINNQERKTAEYDDPAIIVVKGKINAIQEIIKVLEELTKSGKKEVLIIAEELSNDVLKNLVLNKIKGALDVVAIAIPDKDMLEDISKVVGATIADKSTGIDFKEVGVEAIGTAKKIVVTKDELNIINGHGNTDEYVKSLPNKTDHEKNRIARIKQNVAIIRVGGNSQTEIKEKYYRVEDAVPASQVALKGGILPGGGITLCVIADELGSDEGSKVLSEALKMPYKILLENAGLEYQKPTETKGIDVRTSEFVDMEANGVVDPAVVVKEAIKTAVSIAGIAITVGALVAEEEK